MLLKDFFDQLVHCEFENVGLGEKEICAYVASLLTEFADGQQLYSIRDAKGRALCDVGEMLLESDPIYGPAPSFDRERAVRKHIGDYTLFFTGMFPESINRNRLKRHRLESFVDFIRAGKESYNIVAKFDLFEYQGEAPLFAKLSRSFEDCVYGLNCVRQELDAMQHPLTRNPEEPKLLM